MFNNLSELYYEYSSSKVAEAFDQSIYDTALEEVTAAITAAISGKEPMTEGEAERSVMGAMSDAKRQGFMEGFAYASKMWAEIPGR